MCAGIDVIITMLPSAQHVRQVYCGQNGILKAQGECNLHCTLLFFQTINIAVLQLCTHAVFLNILPATDSECLHA